MLNQKRNIRPAREGDDEAVKPQPPADMWERLDAAVAELGLAPKPADAFTVNEYQDRKGLTNGKARSDLRHLTKVGVLEEGGSQNKRWYRFKSR